MVVLIRTPFNSVTFHKEYAARPYQQNTVGLFSKLY